MLQLRNKVIRLSAYPFMRLNIPAETTDLVVIYWQDGFQIEDGELLDYDSPILADFNAGCAYLFALHHLSLI